jgi:hypothetical protein
MDTIVVGIDVSKNRLDVAVRPGERMLRFGRDAAGIESLVGELVRLGVQLVAVEATGGFETVVVASLAAASLPVVVVNPAQVRFRASTRATCQNRPDRRPGDCTLCGGDTAAGAPIARCHHTGTRRSGDASAPDYPNDSGGARA